MKRGIIRSSRARSLRREVSRPERRDEKPQRDVEPWRVDN